MIKVVYADKASLLHPDRASAALRDRWVDVYYLVLSDKAIFHSSCKVKHLKLDNPQDYVLKITDEIEDLVK